MNYEPIIDALRLAGPLQREGQATTAVSYTKSTPHQVVTAADLEAQRIITEAIRKQFPEHGIIAEEQEQSFQAEAEYVWYVDPLDGTRNYASKIPLYGINAALVHNDEQVIFGVTYLPATDEMGVAELGKGTFINGLQVACSQQASWDHSAGIGSIVLNAKALETFQALSDLSHGTAWINTIGAPSASGVYLASGRRDWFVVRSKTTKEWDWAAPSIIMKEAGCVVTNIKGDDWRIHDKEMLAANKHLHPALLEAMQQLDKK
ncbi:MAG: hypothetical protein A2542_00880 [Parcubacteria group bacterium RIFOXYD2_FULL_52_8]|nr:MAG: hypothetical protein A2542_00880 [Parcubacteria group bacterium RIFOXYD2_FULL_52_8]